MKIIKKKQTKKLKETIVFVIIGALETFNHNLICLFEIKHQQHLFYLSVLM